MRCVFTTTLSVDIDADDDALRAAFIELVTQSARGMYVPASMMSKRPPELGASITSRRGKENIPVIAELDPQPDAD